MAGPSRMRRIAVTEWQCDVCAREYDETFVEVPWFKTERGLNLHKSKIHHLRARDRVVEQVDHVRNMQDVIKFAIYRLGCEFPTGDAWKRNAIILSYSGYKANELAQTIEWCANTGKRFDVPWKAIVWVDHWAEEKKNPVLTTDLVQSRLDSLYVAADNDTRKKIRAARYNPEASRALLLELQ